MAKSLKSGGKTGSVMPSTALLNQSVDANRKLTSFFRVVPTEN